MKLKHSPNHRHKKRRIVRTLSKWFWMTIPFALFWLGLTLISMGLFSYIESESPIALFLTERDQVTISTDQTLHLASAKPEPLQTSTVETNASGRLVVPFFYIGDEFGTIRIPSADIDVRAFHGDSESEFRKGVGHYAGSYFPGQGGNILIAGHRTSFFRNFEYLELGDAVEFETAYGTFDYEITGFEIIDGDDESIANDTAAERLTMYTCYPFDFIGNASQRYVVYCTLIDQQVTS